MSSYPYGHKRRTLLRCLLWMLTGDCLAEHPYESKDRLGLERLLDGALGFGSQAQRERAAKLLYGVVVPVSALEGVHDYWSFGLHLPAKGRAA